MVKEKFDAPASNPEILDEDFDTFWERRIAEIREEREQEPMTAETQEKSVIEQWPIHEISDSEREKVFEKIRSEGWEPPIEINQESLERGDLAPKFVTELDDRKIYLSKPFTLNERPSVIGFVEDDNHNYVARPFYRSNSQGLWRLMPNYHKYIENGDEHIGYYGKGWNNLCEDSLNLPIELQNTLQNICCNTTPLDFDPYREKVFMSTSDPHRSFRYSSEYEFNEDHENGLYRNAYYEKIGLATKTYAGGIWGTIRPEKLIISQDLDIAPNFEDKYMSYQTDLGMYGDVTIDCFYSHDHTRKYVYLRDDDERGALLNIELDAPLTDLGVRSKWIEGGRYTTPLYEYWEQGAKMTVLSENSQPNPHDRTYGETYSNYLKKAPFIKDYLTSQGIKAAS